MRPVYGQTRTVLFNYESHEEPDPDPNHLPAWKHAPVAGRAEGACIPSDSTPILSGRSPTRMDVSAASTRTAHTS